MSRKQIKRVFTRSQVEEAFHRTHMSSDDRTYTIARVELLNEVSPPCWRVEFTFTSQAKHFSYLGHVTFIQRIVVDQPVLSIVTTTPIPTGLTSVEEEDAAIQEEWRQFIESERKENEE